MPLKMWKTHEGFLAGVWQGRQRLLDLRGQMQRDCKYALGFDSFFTKSICYFCNQDVECKEKCPCRNELCACPKILRLLCGKNGKTYANECRAECDKQV